MAIEQLVHHISDDVKVLAKDEIELLRDELARSARDATADAAVMLLGAIVALVGLGMLCTAVVVALEPVIPALALRLVIMAAVYLIAGGAFGAAFAARVRRDAPRLGIAKYEANHVLHGAAASVR